MAINLKSNLNIFTRKLLRTYCVKFTLHLIILGRLLFLMFYPGKFSFLRTSLMMIFLTGKGIWFQRLVSNIILITNICCHNELPNYNERKIVQILKEDPLYLLSSVYWLLFVWNALPEKHITTWSDGWYIWKETQNVCYSYSTPIITTELLSKDLHYFCRN